MCGRVATPAIRVAPSSWIEAVSRHRLSWRQSESNGLFCPGRVSALFPHRRTFQLSKNYASKGKDLAQRGSSSRERGLWTATAPMKSLVLAGYYSANNLDGKSCTRICASTIFHSQQAEPAPSLLPNENATWQAGFGVPLSRVHQHCARQRLRSQLEPEREVA